MKIGKLCFVLLLVFSSNILLSQEQITLEDIWIKNTFKPKEIASIRSLVDGAHYTILTETGIVRFSYESASSASYLVDFTELDFKSKGILVEEYEIDEKEEKVLLFCNSDRIYRYSSNRDVYLYQMSTKKLIKLTEKGKQQLTTFSPNGNYVAFVRENNLYVLDLESLEERPVTVDGKKNEIINGATDWVYEEEFGVYQGFKWSPQSDRIAYYRFDESAVKEALISRWGATYPEEYRYKYPKAGEDNSKIEIWVYRLSDAINTRLYAGAQQDLYVPFFEWTKKKGVLSYMTLNRLQNKVEIFLTQVANNKSECVYTEESKTYIEIPKECIFLENNKEFIFCSERDGYNHIYRYDFEKRVLKQIEKGAYDVLSIDAVDEKNKKIYFGSSESSPINRDLYVVGLDGKKKQRLCEELGAHQAFFSRNYSYFVHLFSQANRPPIFSIRDNKGNLKRVLENNEVLVEEIKKYGDEKKEFGRFTTSTGVSLNYWIIKPANFDSTKLYPVLFYVYGGPGSQTVTNKWGGNEYFWYRMLAQKGYVCISVDARGTGNRGEEFKKVTYLNLGKYEVEDQIEAAKYFGSRSWCDKKRIGIFGWSYGGFMSALCISRGADYYKTAISVAPVTSWSYYDNVYTERYMRRPVDNEAGYKQASLMTYVDSVKGNFLLVHGTADDNVHLQNAMDFSTALIKAGKQFEMFLYPNKNHSIYGGNTRWHLYKKMTAFLEDYL